MKYRAEIDGLRALAVVPVVLFHAGFETFSGGFVGVDVFFVISGFLITTILINEMDQGKYSLLNFYERRCRRILPALFAIVLFCIPVSYFVLPPDQMEDFSKSVLAVATFSSNILFWRESGYFDTAAEMKPLLHTWSLAVEEQFYIFFPLILMVAWRFGKKVVVWLMIAGFVISLGMAEWASYNKPMAGFYLLPPRGWELLIGSFAAFYLQKGPVTTPSWVNNIASVLGIALVVFAIVAYDHRTPFPGLYALAPTVGTVLIILFALKGTLAHRILTFSPFVGIGLISYSAYLWHQPFLAFARVAGWNMEQALLPALLSVLSFVAAYFSWKYVETPFRKKTYIARGSRPGAIVLGLFAGMLVFGGIGVWQNGNYWRYDQRVVDLMDARSQWEEYTWADKNASRMRPFRDDQAPNILIIGDSNSGDLLNALMEEYGDEAEFASATIYAGCGNLYFEPARVEALREANDAGACNLDEYRDPALQNLIRKADIVLLASAWREWEAPLVPESVQRLERDFGDKFLVFGTKHLDVAEQEIFSRRLEELTEIDAVPRAGDLAINADLSAALGTRFLDPIPMLCEAMPNGEVACPIFDADGEIVFYDGFHLTPYGAAILGRAIRQEALIDRALQR